MAKSLTDRAKHKKMMAKFDILFQPTDALIRECFLRIAHHCVLSQRPTLSNRDTVETLIKAWAKRTPRGSVFIGRLASTLNATLDRPLGYKTVVRILYNRALRNSPMPPIPDGDLELAAAVAVLQDRLWPKRGRRRT
jgi:hypothetical protein